MPSKQQSKLTSSHKESSNTLPPGVGALALHAHWASQKVSLPAVSFIDAFCRRNLSVDEIAIVGVFIDAAFMNPDTTTHEYLLQLLEKTPGVVTLAPRGSNNVNHQIAQLTNRVNTR